MGFGRQGAQLDVCNVTVEQLAVAPSVVEIATVQSPFNLADTSRADLLAECGRTASAAHLEENVAAASLCLDDNEVLATASAVG